MFKTVGSRFALGTGTSTTTEKTTELVLMYEASTSPPDPYLIRQGKVAPCEPDEDGLFCGRGQASMDEEEVSDSCTWVWNSCHYILYCIDHGDTGLKIQVPTEIDRDGIVQKFSFRKIETGPQYLIAGGIPNPGQSAVVIRAEFERVQD